MLEENYEIYRRYLVRGMFRQRPVEIQKMLCESALSRVHYSFKNLQFGLISPCKVDQTTRENLDSIFRLSEEITNLGFYQMAVIHFWHGLGDKALFISNIEHSQIQEIAEEFKLGSFISGGKGNWQYWESPFDEYVYSGQDLKVVDIFIQYVLFSKIKRKIVNLKIQLKGIRLKHRKHRKLDKHLEETVLGLQSKISDYERLMCDMLGIKE